jgi:1-acyl-sn-glycerol-3-phosphate acyltransferase
MRKLLGRPLHFIYFIRTLLFLVGLWFITAFCGLAAIPGYLMPYRWRYHLIIGLWGNFNCFWLFVTCGVRCKIIDRHNIPKRKAFVALSKHSSTWETASLPVILNCPSIVVKRQLLSIPGFGWGLAICEPIVIDRKQPKRAMQMIIAQGKRYLAKGRQVLLFPEGTRARGEYKTGGAVLAKEAGVPILPIAHNSGDFWPRDRFIIKPGTIYLKFGELIETSNKTPEALTEEVKNWIEASIADLPKDSKKSSKTKSEDAEQRVRQAHDDRANREPEYAGDEQN